MENNALIEELRTLVQNEDALAVSREINELKTRFEKIKGLMKECYTIVRPFHYIFSWLSTVIKNTHCGPNRLARLF